MLWLGDAIYADNWSANAVETIEGWGLDHNIFQSKIAKLLVVMKKKWEQAKNDPAYQELRMNTAINGIWVKYSILYITTFHESKNTFFDLVCRSETTGTDSLLSFMHAG